MIYIIKKMKKTTNEHYKKLHSSEAKEYFYNLTKDDLATGDIYMTGADSEEELQEILSFFHEDFFLIEDTGLFSVYKVNANINKYNRIRQRGASITALKNFKEKIEKKFPRAGVYFDFKTDNFEIFVVIDNQVHRFVCSYDLEILESFADNRTDYINLSLAAKVRKEINGLFRRQRYYYKRRRKRSK